MQKTKSDHFYLEICSKEISCAKITEIVINYQFLPHKIIKVTFCNYAENCLEK